MPPHQVEEQGLQPSMEQDEEQQERAAEETEGDEGAASVAGTEGPDPQLLRDAGAGGGDPEALTSGEAAVMQMKRRHREELEAANEAHAARPAPPPSTMTVGRLCRLVR